MRPGRQLAALGLIFAVLYAMVFFLDAEGGWRDRLEPRLGLDLIGGTSVTLEAATLEGGRVPPADQLERARQIIEDRVNGLGVSEAEVVVEGDRNIVISLAGKSNDQLKQVGTAAELRFRKVLATTDDKPTTAPSPSASPSASGAAPAAAAAATPSGAAPAAAPAPSGAAPSASSSAPAADTLPADVPKEADVRKKVGDPAWQAAAAQTAPLDLKQNPQAGEALKPFETLSPQEVAALPAQMQFNLPQVSCKKLDERPVGSIKSEKQQAVACQSSTKFLLDEAKVLGTDVDGASAGLDPQGGGGWMVTLSFESGGQDRWTALTKEAIDNPEGKCQESALGDEKKCLVAVVLDNKVVSAPEIKTVIPGDATISGKFSRAEAQLLANQLRYGALPLSFTPQEAQSVSATLGTVQLKAGLLAAGIGMLLVILYSFFYYRLLGSVIFLSLILSALLVFGALVVLGRTIGFTLTLAGIAGFIVSLGVAADSFVIYFERLKDEIREGRSPRSAVPRAWIRARRTIISANTISILAAVVLWLFSVGSVRGFAFALGLATFLDLVVVFLFRHPVMTMFARTRAFLSPRVSGLGRVLQGHSADEVATSRPSRVKEA